jgi:hypothetical protein
MSTFGQVAAGYASVFAAGGLAGVAAGMRLQKNRSLPAEIVADEQVRAELSAPVRAAVGAAMDLVAAARVDMVDMSRVLLGSVRGRVNQLVDDPLVRCALVEHLDDLAEMIACRGVHGASAGSRGGSGARLGPPPA